MTDEPTFFFRRIAETTFEPTRHAEGAWSVEDYHFAALAGLMMHEVERLRPCDENRNLELGRVTFDILGRLPFGAVDITVRVIRPGRTIELLESTCSAGGRALITARAWYLQSADSSDVAGVEYDHLPSPASCPSIRMSDMWGGGYINQLVCRQALPIRPGQGAMWLTSPNQLVEGEDSCPVAEFICRVDLANGINPRQSPDDWAFPNVDLTIHLFRSPSPEWTGLETVVTWGAGGIGLTSSTLHDVHGPVGRAEQVLTLRRGD